MWECRCHASHAGLASGDSPRATALPTACSVLRPQSHQRRQQSVRTSCLGTLAQAHNVRKSDVRRARQAFARRLYRFLKRALTLWPQQRAMEPLIALWLAYLAPWGSHSFGSAGARGEHLAGLNDTCILDALFCTRHPAQACGLCCRCGVPNHSTAVEPGSVPMRLRRSCLGLGQNRVGLGGIIYSCQVVASGAAVAPHWGALSVSISAAAMRCRRLAVAAGRRRRQQAAAAAGAAAPGVGDGARRP